MLRVARLVEGHAVAVVQREPGDFLFTVHGITVFADELGELGRRNGLLIDGEVARFQRIDERRKLGIAKTLILRAADGKPNTVTRARLDGKCQLARLAGEVQRLKVIGAELCCGGDADEQKGGTGSQPFGTEQPSLKPLNALVNSAHLNASPAPALMSVDVA